ncbi:Aldehyde dehydrogenase, N-terminal [Teratosphaeria destructans]|uniref:Aldehyde dehydrogenase, N-terminal n=1 Tax=Teratosphaeria destructans TaxID=418781 RepID=A0A9W7VYF4_9PEZI|nr:Aldehyde dehydrogenase, N-terminal [Teratosphaeria destructans]
MASHDKTPECTTLTILISVFRYFASKWDKLPLVFYDCVCTYCTVFYKPRGVCCDIMPFNWLRIHTGGKLAPALATVNTMILTLGERAPLTVNRIVEILQTILPQTVVQVVFGGMSTEVLGEGMQSGPWEWCSA